MQEKTYRGIKTFQKLSLDYLHNISAKKDPLFTRLIFNWAKIMNPAIAQNTIVLKLYTDSNQKKCLLLGCHGSHTTLMQMQSGVILEKINLFLGKNYIQKIIFKAIHMPQKNNSVKAEFPLSTEKEKEIENEVDPISDPEIKRILINLGKKINTK